MKRVSL